MKTYLKTLLLTLIGLATLAAAPARAMDTEQTTVQMTRDELFANALRTNPEDVEAISKILLEEFRIACLLGAIIDFPEHNNTAIIEWMYKYTDRNKVTPTSGESYLQCAIRQCSDNSSILIELVKCVLNCIKDSKESLLHQDTNKKTALHTVVRDISDQQVAVRVATLILNSAGDDAIELLNINNNINNNLDETAHEYARWRKPELAKFLAERAAQLGMSIQPQIVNQSQPISATSAEANKAEEDHPIKRKPLRFIFNTEQLEKEAQERKKWLEDNKINSFEDAVQAKCVLPFLKDKYDIEGDILEVLHAFPKHRNPDIIRWAYKYTNTGGPRDGRLSYLQQFLYRNQHVSSASNYQGSTDDIMTTEKLPEIVTHLLACMADHGESVHYQTDTGETALHYLCCFSSSNQDLAIELAKLILAASPDQAELLACKDTYGFTAQARAQELMSRNKERAPGLGKFLATYQPKPKTSTPANTGEKQGEKENLIETNNATTASWSLSSLLKSGYFYGVLGACVVAAITIYYFWHGQNTSVENTNIEMGETP